MTIRNDSSRPAARLSGGRRARSVVARQGQVLLDVDLNEAAAAAAERTEIGTVDTLGRAVVPFAGGGFKIDAGGKIGAGRFYLDGLLVENLADCTLETQPHPADPVPAKGGIVALKALVRLIDPVEDRALADKALADAAAAGRGIVDWQVFVLPITGGGTPSCAMDSPDWGRLVALSSGQLGARVDPGAPSASFCSPAIGGGFSRLENLHYRVEVEGGKPVAGYPSVDGPRFGLDGLVLKFSRRNASVMTRITGIDPANPRTLLVDPPAIDTGQWFAPGTVAEIVSIDDDVDPTQAIVQNRLFAVAQAADDSVTLGGAAVLPLPPDPKDIATDWYLRLWDCLPDSSLTTTVTLADVTTSTEIDLGDGVRITLHAAASGDTLFRRGDYWSFIARVDGTIDWPLAGGKGVPRVPDGPVVHYARLAATSAPGAVPEDCRIPVLPLAEQLEIRAAGGDGQAAFLGDAAGKPFVPLRAPCEVIVLRGGLPVAGAQVEWSGIAGTGAVRIDGAATAKTVTTADGGSGVTVALDAAAIDMPFGVEARLVLPAGHPAVAPIRFHADFATAARTSYAPGKCGLLGQVTNVQDALDTLCLNGGSAAPPDALTLRRIHLVKPGIELIEATLLRNGADLAPEDLIGGIDFVTDGSPLNNQIRRFDPIVDVTLEIPYPTQASAFDGWGKLGQPPTPFGTWPLRLSGDVLIKEDTVHWRPSPQAQSFLAQWTVHHFGEGAFNIAIQHDNRLRILGRIRLRSQFLWVERGRTPAEIAAATKLSTLESELRGKATRTRKDSAALDKARADVAALHAKREEAVRAGGSKAPPPITRTYLNAEFLGRRRDIGASPWLSTTDRDPQRAGDLDMFFYLVGMVNYKP